jgi:hypothetical protein
MLTIYTPDDLPAMGKVIHVVNNHSNTVLNRLQLALECQTLNNCREQIEIALEAALKLVNDVKEITETENNKQEETENGN